MKGSRVEYGPITPLVVRELGGETRVAITSEKLVELNQSGQKPVLVFPAENASVQLGRSDVTVKGISSTAVPYRNL